ncbi:hypothetical protein MHTCC0001_15010 [Flavobacteriaceae bacterium MHTCC 0001]
MKTRLFLLFIICFGFQIHAQTQVVSVNVGVGLDYDGSHLYVAELFGNKISRLDITTGAPSLETVTSISRPEGIAINGNEVYMTGISMPDRFRVADISGGVPTTNTTILSASSIRTVVYDDTHGLYLIQDAGSGGTRVFKVTGTTATQIITTPVRDIRGATIHGSEMYLSSRGAGAIYKFDLSNVATPTLVKSGITQPYEIEIANNHLYYASENGQLGKIDLANTSASPTLLINNTLGDLAGLEIIGEDIYFTSWGNNAIYKINDPALAPCVVTIPDTNFKTALLNHNPIIDTNSDGEIQCSEASAFTGQIVASSLNIQDLTGIESFTEITGLQVFNNDLTSIDVSQNTKLRQLLVEGNLGLSGVLDLSAMTDLIDVKANDTYISRINMANGNNANVTRFQCVRNSALNCVQLDAGFSPNSNWLVDDVSVYSENCFTLSTIDFSLDEAKLYPNPASTILNIDMLDTIKRVTIYTLLGSEILKAKSAVVDISNLKSGSYLIKIEDENGVTSTKRFIKQ